MGLQIPPGLDWLVKITAGQSWPKGDEDKMRALGREWRDFASQLDGITADFEPVFRQVLDNLGGRPAEQFSQFVTQMHQQFPGLSEAGKQLAQLSSKTAQQIEYSKYMIIAQMALLAAEIAWCVANAPWTAGGSMSLIPALVAASRLTVQQILRRLLTAVLFAVVSQVGLDVAVQTIMAIKAKIKGDDFSWNWQNTLGMIEMGAIGGVLGGGLHLGFNKFRPEGFGDTFGGLMVNGGVTGLTVTGISNVMNHDDSSLGYGLTSGLAGAIGSGGGRRGGPHGGVPHMGDIHVGKVDDVHFGLGGDGLGSDRDVPAAYEQHRVPEHEQSDSRYQGLPGMDEPTRQDRGHQDLAPARRPTSVSSPEGVSGDSSNRDGNSVAADRDTSEGRSATPVERPATLSSDSRLPAGQGRHQTRQHTPSPSGARHDVPVPHHEDASGDAAGHGGVRATTGMTGRGPQDHPQTRYQDVAPAPVSVGVQHHDAPLVDSRIATGGGKQAVTSSPTPSFPTRTIAQQSTPVPARGGDLPAGGDATPEATTTDVPKVAGDRGAPRVHVGEHETLQFEQAPPTEPVAAARSTRSPAEQRQVPSPMERDGGVERVERVVGGGGDRMSGVVRVRPIDGVDLRLGASEELVGAAGYYEPEMPPDRPLEKLPEDQQRDVERRFRERKAEFDRLAADIAMLNDGSFAAERRPAPVSGFVPRGDGGVGRLPVRKDPSLAESVVWERLREGAHVAQVDTVRFDPSTRGPYGQDRGVRGEDGAHRGGGILDGWMTRIAYESRRMEVSSGHWVREFTVRLDTRVGVGVDERDVRRVQDRVLTSIDEHINGRYRLPNGDQLHVRLEFGGKDPVTGRLVHDGPVHGRVTVHNGSDTDQAQWSASASDSVLVHEVLHNLGLKDEYWDGGALFRRRAVDAAVRGVMGPEVWSRPPSLTEEHLRQILDVGAASAVQHDHPLGGRGWPTIWRGDVEAPWAATRSDGVSAEHRPAPVRRDAGEQEQARDEDGSDDEVFEGSEDEDVAGGTWPGGSEHPPAGGVPYPKGGRSRAELSAANPQHRAEIARIAKDFADGYRDNHGESPTADAICKHLINKDRAGKTVSGARNTLSHIAWEVLGFEKPRRRPLGELRVANPEHWDEIVQIAKDFADGYRDNHGESPTAGAIRKHLINKDRDGKTVSGDFDALSDIAREVLGREKQRKRPLGELRAANPQHRPEIVQIVKDFADRFHTASGEHPTIEAVYKHLISEERDGKRVSGSNLRDIAREVLGRPVRLRAELRATNPQHRPEIIQIAKDFVNQYRAASGKKPTADAICKHLNSKDRDGKVVSGSTSALNDIAREALGRERRGYKRKSDVVDGAVDLARVLEGAEGTEGMGDGVVGGSGPKRLRVREPVDERAGSGGPPAGGVDPHEGSPARQSHAQQPFHRRSRAWEDAVWQPTRGQRETLAGSGLEHVDTTPNGDCLFEAAHVTSTGSRPSPQEVWELRQDTVQVLRTQWHWFMQFYGGDHDAYMQAVDDLSRSGVYRTDMADLAPIALAYARGLRVTVLDEHGNPVGGTDDQGRHGYGAVDGLPVTLLRMNQGGGHYLGTRAVPGAGMGDVDMPDVQPARDRTPAESGAEQRGPVVRRLDQGRIETSWPDESTAGQDGDGVWIVRMVEHRLDPDPAMDHAFPWRDPRDPTGRVYGPYAAEDGSVHPQVLARVDEITATMSHGKDMLKAIARAEDDARLPRAAVDHLTKVVWTQLEHAVAAEIKRLTRGEPLASPPVRPARMTAEHVRPHERALIGQWGLFLTRRPADLPLADRPSLLNGRILGVYMGAVLDSQAARDSWEQDYRNYPSYAMDLVRTNRRGITMSAEGVANSVAFANTAVRTVLGPDGVATSRVEYDDAAINAQFVPFFVRLPIGDGDYRVEPISVLVALDNAFDPNGNPHGVIVVDYGPNYLWQFERSDKPIKPEPE